MTSPAMPEPTPATNPFWQGCESGELRIQQCLTTGQYFLFPRLYSPFVPGGAVEWVRASGRATLYSYNILYRGAPGFEDATPYALAVVELEEGPRMMTNIIGIDNTPDNLILDMALEVTFVRRGERTFPAFSPVGIS
jgi:uncharacterized OB-fold protein